MSEPFIYISTWRVKEGKLEELKQYYREIIEIVKEREPQLIAFHSFVNEEGTEMTSIQVHPHVASGDLHMEVLGQAMQALVEKYSNVFELIEGKHIEYYGGPNERYLEMDRQLNIAVDIKPVHIGGFSRATTG